MQASMQGPMQGPIPREEEARVGQWLMERLVHRIGIDVWTRPESGLLRTDRDACTHCDDVIDLAKQLTRLHPGVSWTQYDLDRHADRAEEAGVERPPLMILRGSARSVHMYGLPTGVMFPMFLDVMWFLSVGQAPLSPETVERLDAIEERVEIELFATPYDPYSAQLGTLLGAFAMTQRLISLNIVEASEFPILSNQRGVSEVPVMTINGRRLVGNWGESELVEQLSRILEGNDEPVIRDQVLTSPYMTEEDTKRLIEQQAAQQMGQPGALGVPGAAPAGSPGVMPTIDPGLATPLGGPPSGGAPPPQQPPEDPPGGGLIIPGR